MILYNIYYLYFYFIPIKEMETHFKETNMMPMLCSVSFFFIFIYFLFLHNFHTPSLFIHFHSDIFIRTINSIHYYTMHTKSPLLLFISGGICCLLYSFAFYTLYNRIMLSKHSLSYQDYESLYISSQLEHFNFSAINTVYFFTYNHF